MKIKSLHYFFMILVLFVSHSIINTLFGQTYVTVHIDQPDELIVNAGNDTTIDLGASAQIGGNPTAIGGSGQLTYLWSPASNLNNTTISNPVAQPSGTTTYTILVTDENGCTSSDQIILTVNGGTGFRDNISDNIIQIYPNPSQGNFYINIENSLSETVDIEIITPSGQLLYKNTIDNLTDGALIPIDISHLKRGSYLIKIKAGSINSINKIILH